MNVSQTRDRFDLNDYAVFDQQIQSKTLFKSNPPIFNCDRNLPLYVKAPRLKFVC